MMQLVALLYPNSDGASRRSEAVRLDVSCGTGEQLVWWFGQAACLKLAVVQREIMSRWLPQAVIKKDGTVLDIECVLKEVVTDGEELYVEYGRGPLSYTVRWEGRPPTPDFVWGSEGLVLPPHDVWLTELDLVEEGAKVLLDPERIQEDPSMVATEMEATKALLVKHAGQLQAAYTLFDMHEERDPANLDRMSAGQFKAFCTHASVLHGAFTVESIEDIFSAVTSTPAAMARKSNKHMSSALTLQNFFIAVLHIAHGRFAAKKPDLAPHAQLADKLESLILDCISTNVLGPLSRSLEALQPADTKAARLILGKGRRLLEQALASCRTKRSKCLEVKVEVGTVLKQMAAWGTIQEGDSLSYLGIAEEVLFAKHRSTDCNAFELLEQPMVLTREDFEEFVLVHAYYCHPDPRKQSPAFDDVLGELMDGMFKSSGVLVAHGMDEDMDATRGY